MNITIYPGTFDPITLGHVDLIERATTLFDKVVVAVAINENKKPLFTLEERIELVRTAVGNRDNVVVEGFSSLLTEFAKKHGAKSILRGLRAVSDFDYEFQLASMNRKLAPDIETIFLMPAERYSYISSKLVREIASLQGKVNDFVPDIVVSALKKKFG